MRNGATTLKNSSNNSESCPWPFAGGRLDLLLLVTIVGLLVFGLLMVYSSSYIYAQEKTGDGFAFIKKQFAFALIGVGLLVTFSRISYQKIAAKAYWILGVATLLLLAVHIPGLGHRAGGAQRWIELAGFHFQPGEFAKFAIILFVARQLSQKQDRIHTFSAGVLSNFVLPFPALALLLTQPDFGSTAIVIAVTFIMMFVAGVPGRFLGVMITLGGLAGTYLALGTGYRRARLMTFLDPWTDPGGKGFQILQSLTGFHNGSLWGVGLGNGKEKLFFLPEAHNDFIFSVIGEELGSIGVIAVTLAFLSLVYRGLKIASLSEERSHDRFGMLLATGFTLLLGLQAFVNMSVVLGLLPTKGLNLPFISYGGSSLIADLAAIGVLMSIARGPARTESHSSL